MLIDTELKIMESYEEKKRKTTKNKVVGESFRFFIACDSYDDVKYRILFYKEDVKGRKFLISKHLKKGRSFS